MADDTLTVIDYKNGLGVLVDAEKNPQMMCYALGALNLFDGIYDIRQVSMTIFQPRRDNVSTCTMSKEALLHWAEPVLKPAAELARNQEKGAYAFAVSARSRRHVARGLNITWNWLSMILPSRPRFRMKKSDLPLF